MLNDLAQRGVRKYTAAPPLYRVLWRLGFDIAPPPFATFWSNALLMGMGGLLPMVLAKAEASQVGGLSSGPSAMIIRVTLVNGLRLSGPSFEQVAADRKIHA
jgi:hypothetical protein